MRATCCSYKLPGCKFSAEEVNYKLFTLMVTLKDRGDERAELKIENYFLDLEFDMRLTQKRA